MTGDISVFSEFFRINDLSFFECYNLRGDISALSNLTRMESLRMENNNFTGDISAFRNMENMYCMMISESDIGGDIASLANLTELNVMVLNNTGVYGDISVFANMKNLHELYIENTDIYGDVAVIERLPYLYNFSAYNTLLTSDEQNIQPPEDWNEAYNMMVDPRTGFGETAQDIGENMGANLGEPQSAALSEDGEYYRISAGDNGDHLVGPNDFANYGDFRGNNKAVKIKFRTDSPNSLVLSMFGLGEIQLLFEKNEPILWYSYSEPQVNYGFNIYENYSRYMDTDFKLQPASGIGL